MKRGKLGWTFWSWRIQLKLYAATELLHEFDFARRKKKKSILICLIYIWVLFKLFNFYRIKLRKVVSRRVKDGFTQFRHNRGYRLLVPEVVLVSLVLTYLSSWLVKVTTFQYKLLINCRIKSILQSFYPGKKILQKCNSIWNKHFFHRRKHKSYFVLRMK